MDHKRLGEDDLNHRPVPSGPLLGPHPHPTDILRRNKTRLGGDAGPFSDLISGHLAGSYPKLSEAVAYEILAGKVDPVIYYGP